MSYPFFGDEFTFKQPDGSDINVRGWGDQHYAVFETLDGYTVVKDPISGYWQYATVTDHADNLVPTGVAAGLMQPEQLVLDKGLRISRAATHASAEESPGLPISLSRWEVRRNSQKSAVHAAMIAPELVPAPPQRETVGNYTGLCLLVQFPDVPGTITPQQVDAFCNQQGYTGFGNNGSVFDYFNDVSGGKLKYTNVVTAYYTTKFPRAYYINPQIAQPIRARELIKEALDHLKLQGFNFDAITSDEQGFVYAVNVFYAGNRVNDWAKGLWPHSYHLLTPYELTPGKNAFDYQITDIGNELTLGTFCHENGHMICDFPDLYDYGNESSGIGSFCLMCAGGNVNKKNPTHVCAYLKYQAGWANQIAQILPMSNLTIHADKNDFYILRRNRAEYFIIENRFRAARDLSLPASGLAIWHVDELGSNHDEQMTATQHYECSLIQADNKFNLEHGDNRGDEFDLFFAGGVQSFSDSTQPHSKWWSGSASGLSLSNISAAGTVMTFSATV